jgi:hypothetical protein
MTSATTESTSSPWTTTTADGVWECRVGNIVIQKVPSLLLEDAEYDDFDWCNTCNHHTALKLSYFDGCPSEDDETVSLQEKIKAWEAARTQWRQYYSDRIRQTQMERWFPIL